MAKAGALIEKTDGDTPAQMVGKGGDKDGGRAARAKAGGAKADAKMREIWAKSGRGGGRSMPPGC
jgi:hypothetical protein